MDSPRTIKVKFSDEQERKILLSFLLEELPTSHLALCLGDTSLEIDEISVPEYSSEEWDSCLLIKEGKLPLYPPRDRLREVYQTYFESKPTDVAWFALHRDTDVFCQGMLNILEQEKGVFYAPSERAYRALKPNIVTQGLIPFQLVTLNDHVFLTCFDHGVPFHTPSSTLFRARKEALESIKYRGTSVYMYNKKYEVNTLGSYCTGGGRYSGDDATTDISLPGVVCLALPPPCDGSPDDCIIYNENIEKKCQCFAYPALYTGAGYKNHHLEQLVALSCMDEVKFIRALTHTLFYKSEENWFVDLVPNIPNPHADEEYSQAVSLIKQIEPEESCSIHTAVVDGFLLMKIYLGFVKLPKR